MIFALQIFPGILKPIMDIKRSCIDKPALDKRMEDHFCFIWIRYLHPEADRLRLKPAQIPVLDIIKGPPPEPVQFGNTLVAIVTGQGGQFEKLGMGRQVLVGFYPGH